MPWRTALRIAASNSMRGNIVLLLIRFQNDRSFIIQEWIAWL
jgi:hypothetical protein